MRSTRATNSPVAGRHAVVTGGSRGIGRAVAGLLQRRGALVSVVSRSVRPGGLAPFFAPADVADEEEVRRSFRACRAANGPIAILVNGAGIAESGTVARTDTAMWDRILATNLTGTFLCTREALADMAQAGWGRIVTVASVAGLSGAAYVSAYCASKHGVIGFTRAVAVEFEGTGVTANAVCPGYTDTEMFDRTIGTITAKTKHGAAAARELLARGNPQGRIATPDEVAEAVLELIEGSATGTEVVVPR